MELYCVEIQFKDMDAWEVWKRHDYDGSVPQPKHLKVYVAVNGAFGGDSVSHAVDLAITRRIGPRECWEDYQVFVVSVLHIGGVCIEPDGTTSSREASPAAEGTG